MSIHPVDIIVIAIYFGVMAFIGYYFSKRNKNTEEYFLGGRSFSGWAIGLSLVGTSISSVTFLAYPADAFKTSWIRFIPNLALPVAVLMSAYLFLPYFRRNRVTSAYEFLEDRFGPSIRGYAAVCFIIGQLVRVSIILYLVSLLIFEMTGLNIYWSIVISGLLVSGYTIAGGFDAVIWTDVCQTIILFLGGVACLVIIANTLPGGLGQIFHDGIAAGKFSFNDVIDGQARPIGWGLSLTEKTGAMLFFLGLTGWLTEYSGNQCTIQRYAAAKSTTHARQAMLVCVLSSLPIWAFYMLLGTALFVFFQVFPSTEAAEMLNGTREAEQVLPFFIMKYVPIGIKGLVISAALAAAMSSLSSSINSISTISVVDLYKRYFNKTADDRRCLTMAKIAGVATSTLMIAGAIVLAGSETQTLQDAGTILSSIVAGGLFGIYALGFFTKIGDARCVWIGITCTVLFTLWTILAKSGVLPESMNIPFELYYTMIIGNLVMFLVSFSAAALTRKMTNK
ncbi:sodium:solute symporter family transporter [Tichowtungia aerotolerans]|uniref:Sodium/solute symporter n=1 Tax=Tichowtungia aerotolerans TaxID=2697043 RepID=A0A6P1MDJ5_9BACT|nr:sodium/solute symporter [Tichowtungia aerotolerans]QHI69175.1 sodium/solute symporter [Tichowtungia aerotolerans]